MEQQRFFYSRWYTLYPFVYSAFFWGILSLNKRFWIINPFSDPWTIVPVVLASGILIYTLVKYTIPMLCGKTFLELDSEKIYVRPKDKLVYWTDIEKITTGDLPEKIILKLYNKKKIRIYVRNVRGNDDSIYKTILAYHQEATHPASGGDGKLSTDAPVVS